MYGDKALRYYEHKRPEPETTAELQGNTEWNGKRRFLGLGAAERYRNRRRIIDGRLLEPDRSRKG